MLLLVVVNPFGRGRKDASVGNCMLEIRFHLQELVGGAELASVLCGSVANDYLRRVLVGHHNGGLGQAGTESPWVVGLKWLLCHASMHVVSLLVDSPISTLACLIPYLDHESVSDDRLTLP